MQTLPCAHQVNFLPLLKFIQRKNVCIKASQQDRCEAIYFLLLNLMLKARLEVYDENI
jgi:hypothetical protein